MTSHDAPRKGSVAWVAAADATALILFVVVGIRSHHEVGALDLFLRNAIPLLSAWFIVGGLTGAYRRPGFRTLLGTWAVAVPVGLIARSLWVGSPTGGRLLVFLGIGLVFTALFLTLGRALARFGDRRCSRSSPERDSIAP